MMIKGETLVQYIIDTSDVVLEKRQDATEYLAALSAVAEKMAERLRAVKNYAETCTLDGADMAFTKDDAAALAEYDALKG